MQTKYCTLAAYKPCIPVSLGQDNQPCVQEPLCLLKYPHIHIGYWQHYVYYGGIRLFIRTSEIADSELPFSIFSSSLAQLRLFVLGDKPEMECDYVIQVAVLEPECAPLASRPQVHSRKSALFNPLALELDI